MPIASSSDTVFVKGLEFEASHGYTAAERKATRRFRVNLELQTKLHKAAASDRLSDTVDYRRLCEIVVECGTKSTFRLLEKLAGHIAEQVLAEYPKSSIVVEVEKLAPPCPGVPASCGVRIALHSE